jgi:hypothetical protein
MNIENLPSDPSSDPDPILQQLSSDTFTDTIPNNMLMDDVWELNREVVHDPNLVTGDKMQNPDNDDWDAAWDDVLNIHEAHRKIEHINEKNNDKITISSKPPVVKKTIQTPQMNKTSKNTKPTLNIQKYNKPYDDSNDYDCDDYDY